MFQVADALTTSQGCAVDHGDCTMTIGERGPVPLQVLCVCTCMCVYVRAYVYVCVCVRVCVLVLITYSLTQDFTFLDLMSHFDRERIPERVVNAKGAGI